MWRIIERPCRWVSHEYSISDRGSRVSSVSVHGPSCRADRPRDSSPSSGGRWTRRDKFLLICECVLVIVHATGRRGALYRRAVNWERSRSQVTDLAKAGRRTAGLPSQGGEQASQNVASGDIRPWTMRASKRPSIWWLVYYLGAHKSGEQQGRMYARSMSYWWRVQEQ